MCGIIAVYKTSERSLDPTVVESMTSALAHRGLEDFGYAFATNGSGFNWRDETPNSLPAKGVAMGHRRMAIFDLSTKGRQPFVTPDERYWMVFNGEIYNFWEIRDDLKAMGHSFTSDSDTEVLLAAFAEWGQSLFQAFQRQLGRGDLGTPRRSVLWSAGIGSASSRSITARSAATGSSGLR